MLYPFQLEPLQMPAQFWTSAVARLYESASFIAMMSLKLDLRLSIRIFVPYSPTLAIFLFAFVRAEQLAKC